MRVGPIRILAWGLTFVVAAAVLFTSGKRHERSTAKPRDTTAAAMAIPPPALFPNDGPAGVLPLPCDHATETRAEVRDPQLRTAHVIREPMGRVTTDPELTLSKSYRLDGAPALRFSPSTRIPLAAVLKEPPRAEAPVEPRVSRDMTSEPVIHGPPPSPLAIVSSANPAMQPVNAAAREHVVRGFSLGDKAAVYAARTEFIQALRTIAQAIDAQAGLAPKDPQSCSLALVRGLQALSEADDFAPSGSRLDGDLDLGAIIAAHRTPAGKKQKPTSQLAAMQAYFDYARAELQRAAAANPVASQALAGLGKSYTVLTEKNPSRLAPAKAMVFHQAAINADPRNHLAANELGVLLAKHGQWEPAKEAFLQSLRVQSDAATWQSLAGVHQQLGERDLAQLAEQERQMLLGKSSTGSMPSIDGTPTVQWVDPKAFAGPPEDVPAPQNPSRPAAKTAASVPQKSDPKSWLKLK